MQINSLRYTTVVCVSVGTSMVVWVWVHPYHCVSVGTHPYHGVCESMGTPISWCERGYTHTMVCVRAWVHPYHGVSVGTPIPLCKRGYTHTMVCVRAWVHPYCGGMCECGYSGVCEYIHTTVACATNHSNISESEILIPGKNSVLLFLEFWCSKLPNLVTLNLNWKQKLLKLV